MGTEIRMLAAQLRDEGRAAGLPLVATCADISSARPALDESGAPVASNFDFTQEGAEYWRVGDLALHNGIISIVRAVAEPFYYDDGRIGSWHPIAVPDKIVRQSLRNDYAVRSAIVVPVRLPRSTTGAVVWATDRVGLDVGGVFDERAARFHSLASRFIMACDVLAHGAPVVKAWSLTRREVQCLKLVAAGKTDGEIAVILGVSAPTVRFHMKKASVKLEENGRLRTAQRALELGYVSARC